MVEYNTIQSSCNPYIGDEGASQTEASDDCLLLISRLTCILFMYLCNSMSHFFSHYDETKRAEEEALFRQCNYIPNVLYKSRNTGLNRLVLLNHRTLTQIPFAFIKLSCVVFLCNLLRLFSRKNTSELCELFRETPEQRGKTSRFSPVFRDLYNMNYDINLLENKNRTGR